MTALQNVLVIRPRWMSDEACAIQVRRIRQLYPLASLTMIAEAPPAEPNIAFVPLPASRRSPRLLNDIFRLRQKRYEAAFVLTDDAHPDSGYGESKFWAFLSRARSRRFGESRPLSLPLEVADKWQRLVKTERINRQVNLTVTRALAPERRERAQHVIQSRAVPDFHLLCEFCRVDITGATEDAPEEFRRCPQCRTLYRFCAVNETLRNDVGSAWSNTWRYISRHHRGCGNESIRLLAVRVYLSECQRRWKAAMGRYLDIGRDCGLFVAVAREQGWQTVSLEGEPQSREVSISYSISQGHTVYETWDQLLAAETHTLRFITDLRAPGEVAELLARLKRYDLLLDAQGVVLLRLPDELNFHIDTLLLEESYHLYFPSREAVQTAASQTNLCLLAMEASLFEDGCLDVWLGRPVLTTEGMARHTESAGGAS